jgi:hypothetical protein
MDTKIKFEKGFYKPRTWNSLGLMMQVRRWLARLLRVSSSSLGRLAMKWIRRWRPGSGRNFTKLDKIFSVSSSLLRE